VQRSATSIARQAYAKHEQVAEFLATHAKRADSLPAKILVAALKGMGPKVASEVMTTETREARLAELRMAADASKGKTAKITDADAQTGEGITKTTDKTASHPYGLYGYGEKVAKLGLQACADLRHDAGKIAHDLHSRRTANHGPITDFFASHSKKARCMYSRLLAASYPEMTRMASKPQSVQGWLEWDH
jgi:hypothetical protein